MKTTTIEKLERGAVFQFTPNGSLYVADGYNRSTGKYTYSKYSNINSFGEKRKGTTVYID